MTKLKLLYNINELKMLEVGDMITYKASKEKIPQVFMIYEGIINDKYSFIRQNEDCYRPFVARRSNVEDLTFDSDGRVLFDDEKTEFITYSYDNCTWEDIEFKNRLLMEAGVHKG